MFGGILHDEGGGTVHRTLGREPVVSYRMSPRDRARIPFLLRTMAETFFEAGAKEVFMPILGLRGVDADAMRKLDLERVPPRRIECSSQHPLGGVQMGADTRSVVDSNGRVRDAEQLYVVDGSIVPTSLGVNPQLSIMSIATRAAWRMRDTPLG
jgi:choline dehydrogenase-like flavoprotein